MEQANRQDLEQNSVNADNASRTSESFALQRHKFDQNSLRRAYVEALV